MDLEVDEKAVTEPTETPKTKQPRAPKSAKEAKKPAKKASKKADADDEEAHPEFETNQYVKLSSKKWASYSKFKGREYVNIREYYEKDGKIMPTKKGVMLTAEEWAAFVEHVDEMKGWIAGD